jgi:Plasmid pRiA4b ORF-3-like protein
MTAEERNRVLSQLKVTLRDIHPPVWRRLAVWEDTTLAQLHRVLQIVVGWEDYHLHQFVIGRRVYSVPDPDDDLYERKVINESRVRLREVVPRVGTRFEYLYDFGDSWRHDLLLEAMVLPDPEAGYPRCLAGERSAPPEDAGGPSGYADYLEAMTDPGHEEHENMLQWRGPFDPEAFSLTTVNQQLQEKRRSVRKTTTRRVSPPENTGTDRSPHAAALVRVLLTRSGTGIPPKDRKRIRPDDKVPLELNDRERELILNHSLADEELTGRLRILPRPGEPPVYRFTLDDLDELAGCVAAEANHTQDKKQRKEWDQLLSRISAVLESYTDEDDVAR